MSNVRYRSATSTSKPADAAKPVNSPRPDASQANPPKPRASLAPTNLARAEANVRGQQLISAAVERLYKQRGGARLDAQLRLYDLGIAIACLCREQELKRAQAGEVLREKGERPLMSNSESRLYSTKQAQLMDRRDELMAACREIVMTAVRNWEARNDEELQAALESVFNELSDTGRAVIRGREAEVAAAQEEVNSIEAQSNELFARMDKPEDGSALMKALEEDKQDVVAAILERQSKEWQTKWMEVFMRAQKFA
ncbi:MAG: hypothetical protein IT461_06635 [Planctomycetes bacterium]|nr:hypothetical protein [Planctomycetota bacterium]